jgi:uncharacterized membrane protein
MTDRRLGIAIAAISVLGLCIASYLTYIHFEDIKPLCFADGGCETVQASRYAKFVGIPVPVLGLLGYVGILFSLLIPGDIGRAITALLALFGFGFSMYLTWLELFRIKAICQWCVASAILMTVLAILTVWRLWRYQPPVAATLQN